MIQHENYGGAFKNVIAPTMLSLDYDRKIFKTPSGDMLLIFSGNDFIYFSNSLKELNWIRKKLDALTSDKTAYRQFEKIQEATRNRYSKYGKNNLDDDQFDPEN